MLFGLLAASLFSFGNDFKKAIETMYQQRADGYLWWQIAENTFDTYMMIQQRKKLL